AMSVTDEADFRSRIEIARGWLQSGQTPEPAEVARRIGRGIAALDSCITAIYLALRFLKDPFRDLQNFVQRLGGDVDTIGAMAGALWGAANGASTLPHDLLGKLEDRQRIQSLANDLYRVAAGKRSADGPA